MPNEPSSDQDNLRALQKGEPAALNLLIARWQRPLHSFAYRYCQNREDAEDLVAQTFAKLYQQRLRLRPDTKLSAWMFTTLMNLCRNHHRWKRRHPTVSLHGDEAEVSHSTKNQGHTEPTGDSLTPEQKLEQDEILSSVRAAIARLPHDLKVTLLLHHYDRLSYQEISAITGCSERGVETRLYRARQKLREMLAGTIDRSLLP